MAEPQDSTTVIFEDLSAAIRIQDRGELLTQFQRLDGATNRLFKPTKRKLTGKVLEVHNEHRISSGARCNDNILADITEVSKYEVDKYNVTLDETAGNNDLHRVSTGIMITEIDVKRMQNNPSEIVNLALKLRRDATRDWTEHLAFLRQADSNAIAGVITGDPVQNDDFFFDGGTAHTSQTSVRVKLSTPIAYFHDGQTCDVHDTGNATARSNATSLTVIDANYADQSIGLSGSSDLVAIVTGDEIFFSGERGKGFISLGTWFERETTIFGKDRTTAGNRWLECTHIRSEETVNASLQPSWLDQAALAAQYIAADSKVGYVLTTTPEIHTQFLQLIQEQAWVPVDPKQSELTANWGFTGLQYHHPSLGRVGLQPDPFHPTNKIRLIRPDQWEFIWGTTTGFHWIQGQQGIFYRPNSTTNAQYHSMMWRAEGYMIGCDICTNPRQQIQINAISQ